MGLATGGVIEVPFDVVVTTWTVGNAQYFRVTQYTESTMYRLTFCDADPKGSLKELINNSGFPKIINDTFLRHVGLSPNKTSPSALSHDLPGISKKVKHPVTGAESTLHSIIMQLNDCAQTDKNRPWSREEIADWIEEVMPLEEIMFKSPEVRIEKGQVSKLTRLVETKRLLPG